VYSRRAHAEGEREREAERARDRHAAGTSAGATAEAELRRRKETRARAEKRAILGMRPAGVEMGREADELSDEERAFDDERVSAARR
jgi:hypothetical protein